MKLVVAELNKLRQNYVYLFCLAGLILINLFLLWTKVRPLDGRAPASAYRKIAHELQGLSAQEQLSLVEQQLEQTTGLYKIDQILRTTVDSPQIGKYLREQNAGLFERYGELYQKGDYLQYADTLSQEYFFLDEIARECEQVVEYDAFLDEIENKAELLSEISVFSANGNDNYTQQNIRSTAAAYEGMRGRSINYAPQKGLIIALNFIWSDVILILGMLILASALVRQERDNGMLALIRSTPRGRLSVSLAKLAALAVALAILLIALYGVNLLYCGVLYNLGDLSRSIQSVPDLMRSTLKVDVAGYLALFLLSKWAAAFICGVWVLWACLVARHALVGYALAVGLPAANILVRALIPATSRWNVIKYANLASLMQNNELLGGYRNLYWFDKPVQLALVELIAAILICGVFVLLFCITFKYAQLATSPHRVLGHIRFFLWRLLRMKTFPQGLFFQECYKILILCGAAVFFVTFLGFQIYDTVVSKDYISVQEIYYAKYMKHLAGPVKKEKLDWLLQEGQKFKPLTQAQQDLANGSMDYQQYQSLMNSYYSLQQEYDVYQQVLGKLYYLKEHSGAYFIYDTGYAKLFDYDGSQDEKEILFCGFVLTICLCGTFSIEYSTDMQRVIRSTPLGRRTLFWKKIVFSSILSVLVSVIILIPRVWQVGSLYGFSAVTAPLYSLAEYSAASPSIPVFMLIFVSFIARLVAAWTMAMIILQLSQGLKNMFSTAIVGGLFLCMPALLNFYGLEAAKWFSLYPLFHFGAMMQQTDTAVAAWLFLVIWFFIGCEILYYTYSNWCD